MSSEKIKNATPKSGRKRPNVRLTLALITIDLLEMESNRLDKPISRIIDDLVQTNIKIQ